MFLNDASRLFHSFWDLRAKAVMSKPSDHSIHAKRTYKANGVRERARRPKVDGPRVKITPRREGDFTSSCWNRG